MAETGATARIMRRAGPYIAEPVLRLGPATERIGERCYSQLMSASACTACKDMCV